MAYRLLKHKDYDRTARRLPQIIQNKALWAQVLLGMRGRTPSVKGTLGINARWRRTPVQGNHYYMWWIPRSESLLDPTQPEPVVNDQNTTNTILIHSIRHHDETDEPIDLGSLADYEEVSIARLDPRYDEQFALSQQVNHEQVALATIKGLPGSGKTISLLYLVKDLVQRPDIRKVLYVTYTGRLKRAAREFLLAQDEFLSQAVTIHTLSEVEKELTKLPTAIEPFTELRNFTKYVDLQNNTTLGPWRRYPQTLYTEVRAHLFGKHFPPSYTLPPGKMRELLARTGGSAAASYAAARELSLPTATLAFNFAERLQGSSFFQDQRAAQRGLELLQRGKLPTWLAELDALIVDEVQDLTLVQIALLGELVRARLRRRPDAPFVFAVAGDESQIVQPSGFDWGLTKDLLGEQIGLWPEEFEFHYQRRAPRNLAQLIDNTWRFYRHLPKTQRPSAHRHSFAYEPEDRLDSENPGRILLCATPPVQPSTMASWSALLTELADKPGRVIVDLSESLRTTLAGAQSNPEDEIIFLAREIKGLERATVLIYGLNAAYERARRLCDSHDDDNIPRFEARRLFDEIRVALSRSTEKIVLLEPPDAPVLAELGISELPGVGTLAWDLLLDTLQSEERSDLEVVEGYLDEVDDLFERSLWEQGYRRNRRAYDLAVQIGDRALQREAEEQFIRGYLNEATSLLQSEEWLPAYERNRQAADLAARFTDPLLLDEVEDQFAAIQTALAEQARRLITQALDVRPRQHAVAYAAIYAAQTLAEKIPTDHQLVGEVDEALTLLAWEWAALLINASYAPAAAQQAATLLAEATGAMRRQSDEVGANATALLAERYRTIPQADQLDEAQIMALLTYTERYVQLVQPLASVPAAYLFAERWLRESLASLAAHTGLYYRWAMLAQHFATLVPTFDVDEPLWDLENRLKLLLDQGKRERGDPAIAKFLALVAGYNGDAQAASITWEQLGELGVAADYAREAGDLERAFRLLHQAKINVPEELATAVRATRLLQQLRTKHTNLRPAERRALLSELETLRTLIIPTEPMEER
jgi:hypothetical protein